MELIGKLMDMYLSDIKDYTLNTINIKMTCNDEEVNVCLLENNLDTCLESWSDSKILETLHFLDDHYYNGKSLVQDSTYDKIIDYYKIDRGQTYDKIGAPIKGEKVKLPIHMGSMDKVKPGSSELKNYFIKYNNTKCVMDKLDGTSLLVDLRIKGNPRAFTRGNGTYGQDISHKIKYINGLNLVKKWSHGGFVRGELIVPKEHWESISDKGANARNYVSGVINKKLIDIDNLKHITFVAYEWAYENDSYHNKSISQQLQLLRKGGFNTVTYKLYSQLTEAQLPDLLSEFREDSLFEIDGIIIQDDVFYPRNTSKNPKYAKAFKMDTMCESAITTVKSIKWNISKDGSLRPVVIFDEVPLSGVNISRASGYNAQYINDNKLGKGAKIKIIRSGEVIPKIIDIISSTAPEFPDYKYYWDKNETHIILDDVESSKDVQIEQIIYFCRTLGIEYFKKGLITKAYHKGCNSILKVLSLDEEILNKYNIEGVKSKTSKKIVESIKKQIGIATMGDFAAATPYFNNMAKKRMNIVNSKIPDWLTIESLLLTEKINNLDGFSAKTTSNIINGRCKFNQFYKQCCDKKIQVGNSTESENEILQTGDKFKDKVFLFTGFRDPNLKQLIITNGGDVREGLSKKITHLVVPSYEFTNSKVEKAQALKISILTKQDELFK